MLPMTASLDWLLLTGAVMVVGLGVVLWLLILVIQRYAQAELTGEPEQSK